MGVLAMGDCMKGSLRSSGALIAIMGVRRMNLEMAILIIGIIVTFYHFRDDIL